MDNVVEKIKVNSIIVKDRIRKDLGNIAALAENIRELGLLSPILVNEHYQLLAGERRLAACKSLGWEEIPAIIMDTADAERELAVEFAENRYRKDFNREEIVDTGIRLERILSVKAQDRIKAGKSDPSQNSDEGSGRTDDAVSNNLGISRDTYRKMKYIVDNKDILPEGDYINWNTEVISTNKTYNKIRSELNPPTAKVKVATATEEATTKLDSELQRKIHQLNEIIENQQEVIAGLQATIKMENPDYFTDKLRAEEAESKVVTLQNEIQLLKYRNERQEERLDEKERIVNGIFKYEEINPDLESSRYLEKLYSDIDDLRSRLTQVSNSKIMRSVLNNEVVRGNFLDTINLYYEAYRDLLLVFERNQKIVDVTYN